MTFRHVALAALIEAVKIPINALRKLIIMDLLKFLFFTFKLAWQLLLAAGAVFLWLLSLLPDTDEDDELYSTDSGVSGCREYISRRDGETFFSLKD